MARFARDRFGRKGAGYNGSAMPKRNLLHAGEILEWDDAHYERTGTWPTRTSGRVLGSDDEKWNNLDTVLRQGLRGLRPGSSLARLLALHRGRRNRSPKQIRNRK